jgi:hypothetical protein
MPLDNRYVVAAFDTRGERVAFISPTFEWVRSARNAEIFQSQIDANYFINKNNLGESTDSTGAKIENFDHVQSLFVQVEIKNTSPEFDPENPDRGISFSGMG